MQAAPPAMRPYVIELPKHTLRFSLPLEIARELSPLEVESQFDPSRPKVFDGGFREIAGHLYDINGPVWVGAYGSLKFHFIVQKRSTAFDGDITTVEGLEHYVRQWNATIRGRDTGCAFSRALLNGMPAVRREWNRFLDPANPEPDHLVIFSLPLDDQMFLDVGFNIMEWAGGRGKEGKWKPKAEALREAIKSTIVLEPKRP